MVAMIITIEEIINSLEDAIPAELFTLSIIFILVLSLRLASLIS